MITPAIQSKKAHATSAVGTTNSQQIRFLRLPKVLEKTGLSKTTVYTLPDFPRPVKIKAGAGLQGGARWVESEIDEWMQSLIQLRDSRTSARADTLLLAVPPHANRFTSNSGSGAVNKVILHVLSPFLACKAWSTLKE